MTTDTPTPEPPAWLNLDALVPAETRAACEEAVERFRKALPEMLRVTRELVTCIAEVEECVSGAPGDAPWELAVQHVPAVELVSTAQSIVIAVGNFVDRRPDATGPELYGLANALEELDMDLGPYCLDTFEAVIGKRSLF